MIAPRSLLSSAKCSGVLAPIPNGARHSDSGNRGSRARLRPRLGSETPLLPRCPARKPHVLAALALTRGDTAPTRDGRARGSSGDETARVFRGERVEMQLQSRARAAENAKASERAPAKSGEAPGERRTRWKNCASEGKERDPNEGRERGRRRGVMGAGRWSGSSGARAAQAPPAAAPGVRAAATHTRHHAPLDVPLSRSGGDKSSRSSRSRRSHSTAAQPPCRLLGSARRR
jgi:hypothetical protein